MLSRRALLLVCLEILLISTLLISSMQSTQAQDTLKYLTGAGGLTPEGQEVLQRSQDLKALTPEAKERLLRSRDLRRITPEEVERGKAELDKVEKERMLREIEKEEEEIKEFEEIERISSQEKELLYILNKYKDRTIRNIYVITEEFFREQLIEQNINIDLNKTSFELTERDIERLNTRLLEHNLEKLDIKLLDILDQYEEDVIRDIVNTFQVRAFMYRDSTSKLRAIFANGKKQTIPEIKEFLVMQLRSGRIPSRNDLATGLPATGERQVSTTAGLRRSRSDRLPTPATEGDQLAIPEDPLANVFQNFIERVVKDVLDNFTLKWAVKDILRPYQVELPYAKPVEELQMFGHELFSRPPETFTPATSVPVSDDYRIGPGDEIKVLMWGRIDAEYSLVVYKDGTIQFPRIGSISVAGLSYRDMKKLLQKKAESITGVNISVSMGRLRSITVFVVGEAKKPGAYTVSAYDTVINALLIAGGPTELGSLRNVQLKRNDKIITTVDFYDFLLGGKTSRDRRLQPGDVVFIPEVKNLVAVAGNVKRAAIYELRGDRSLRTLINLAGGLAPSAYKQRLQIERSFEHQKQVVLDLTYDGLGTAAGFLLQDGDVVKVYPISPDKVDAVYVYGNVQRSGSFAYRPGMRVSDVIRDETELKSDTDFGYALLKRYVEPDMHTELVPFNLGKAILTRNEESNIKLMPYDEIYIFNKWLFAYKPYARIKGEIRKPDNYPLQEQMRIKDLVIAAGGLGREAYLGKNILFRTDPKTRNVTLLTFNLEKALEDSPDNNLLLQDQDEVIIHSITELKPKEHVSIYGMVNNPGEFPLAVGMTVKDLIMVGGYLRKGAYKEEAELVRVKLVDGTRMHMETEVLSFNVARALADDPQDNLDLREYDRIFIKEIPKWMQQMIVRIEGEVYFPGEYYVWHGEKLSSLIERAGGFTRYAYPQGAFFTRERVREVQKQRLDEMISRMESEIAAETGVEVTGALSIEEVEAFKVSLEAKKALVEKLKEARVEGRMVIRLTDAEKLRDSKFDLRLEDGDSLSIPKTPQFVNVLGEVYNPTSFVYEPGQKVSFYLNRAGGPTENAQDDEIYIIRADGSVLSKAQGGRALTWDHINHRWTTEKFKSAKIYPGDTVLVPRELVKIHWIREVKDITQILFQIAVVVGVIAAI